jgi:prevent-host-death family protein
MGVEVNVHEAKTQLSRLLKRVTDGEEVIISRAGVPVARLIPVGPEDGVRPMGMDRNRIWIAEDFDAPDPELEDLFYQEISTRESSKKPMPPPATDSSRRRGKKKA